MKTGQVISAVLNRQIRICSNLQKEIIQVQICLFMQRCTRTAEGISGNSAFAAGF